GDPQVQGSDRPAVRGESDAPAGRREAGLRGDCSGHHRGRHQGGGDRWQKSRGARGQVQRSRHQGDPQVHRHQTCDICREVRRGHDQHRRLRVWGPPWGRRRAFAVWVLLPKAVKSLRVPVIVSGACANGQQLAGALAMGAAGE
ncbi:unnamed protein product, partial [Prorocentrum cordatum]